MSDLKISDKDRNWLRDNHPGLSLGTKNNTATVSGKILIDMIFQGVDKPYIINPDPNNLPDGERIEDTYELKILMKGSEHSSLPQVFETGGRVEKIVQELGLKLADLHFNPGSKAKAACLCLRTEEDEKLPNGYSLEEFFNRLVIPFFYAQSYFEKYVTWPWGQYSHGELGLLEWYSIQNNPTKEETEKLIEDLRGYKRWDDAKDQLMAKSGIKGHLTCLCDEEAKYRNCHKKVFHGMWKLQANIKKFDLKL